MQDERSGGRLVLPGMLNMREAVRGDLSKLDVLTVLKVESNSGCRFSELLSWQLFLYKDSIKEVFDAYIPELEHKGFGLMDMTTKQICYYSCPGLRVHTALSEKSELRPLRDRRLILDSRKLRDLDYPDIFRMGELDEQAVAVSLPVAESLLRREIEGIRLVHMESDGEV